MTALFITLAALFLVVALAGHEWAHAAALRRLGVPISEAGLGVPLGPSLRWTATWGGHPVRFRVTPWLLMAYVKPHPDHAKQIEALNYRDSAWYLGAGVAFNTVLGGVLMAAGHALLGHWWRVAIFATVAALVGVFHRKFTAYALPPLGLLCAAALAWIILTADPSQPQGPVGIGVIVSQANTLARALIIGGAINLGFAQLNATPLYPMDAGRIYSLLIGRRLGPRFNSAFQAGTFVWFAGLMIYALATDAGWLTS